MMYRGRLDFVIKWQADLGILLVTEHLLEVTVNFLSVDPLRQVGGSSLGGFSVPGFQSTDQACLRCAGAGPLQGAADPTTLALLQSGNQLMGQMLQLLQVMLMGLMLNGGAGASSLSDMLAQAGGQSSGQVAPAENTSGGNDASQQSTPPAGGHIGSGSKVLVIGDSHTAGTYGDELDRLLRGKGAQVHTVGSSGATADQYISGAGTKVGYADHKLNGQTEKTAAHATPKLEDLIAQDKPDTIVVNLGANFRGAGPSGIKAQVNKLGEIAKRHNIKIVWVGPPRTRDDMSNPSSLQKFDQDMAAAVQPFGQYISSAPFTPEYSGTDGVHYGGSKGTELAKKWAAGVAGAL